MGAAPIDPTRSGASWANPAGAQPGRTRAHGVKVSGHFSRAMRDACSCAAPPTSGQRFARGCPGVSGAPSAQNQSAVGWTGIIECAKRHLSERLYCFRLIIATDQILHLVNDIIILTHFV